MELNEQRRILERLKALEEQVSELRNDQRQLKEAYGSTRLQRRRALLRPPMWVYEQHSPRVLTLPSKIVPVLPAMVPSIAIVTPSYNQAQFLSATIDSVLNQNYPKLSYRVQDGGSRDGSVEILESYGDKIGWRSAPDKGQSDAINLGFKDTDSEIMAYLNSDDMLLPGTLPFVANFFHENPDIDLVYGHRVFIDHAGSEIGRAILPAHSDKALLYAGYIPQETLFWRRRVWERIGEMDTNFDYAMDWDFMLRAQQAGFRFARARRFLACFRVHDRQKTSKNYDVGFKEMTLLRRKYLGYAPTQSQIFRALSPYLARQLIFHWSHRLGLLNQ